MDPIGKVNPIVNVPGITTSGQLTGIILLLNAVLRLIFIIAGLFAFFNILMAGISFISAGGDPKKVQHAWEKIWKSFLGLVIIVTSFILAAVIGIILFKDPSALLNPRLTPVK